MNNNFHLLWFIRLPKINHVILFFCFILLFYTLPVYNQVHIKERVEIIPTSQDKQRDFREFYIALMNYLIKIRRISWCQTVSDP